MNYLLNLALHLDQHLQGLIQSVGPVWSYVILFGVLFAETGFVITPFLPGDSLIFVTGALLAKGSVPISLPVAFVVFSLGAILGDTVNFEIGKHFGRRLFERKTRFLNPENLERTEKFFAKHGGKTIILARFVPVVRTFAPFVAGTGKMTYPHFIAYNIFGGLLWVALFLFGGYLFGNLPFIQDHFVYVVAAIVVLSLVPAIYEYVQTKREKSAGTSGQASEFDTQSSPAKGLKYGLTGDAKKTQGEKT